MWLVCTVQCVPVHFIYVYITYPVVGLAASKSNKNTAFIPICMHACGDIYLCNSSDHNKQVHLQKLWFIPHVKLLHHHNAATTKMWYSHSRFRCTLDTFYVERVYGMDGYTRRKFVCFYLCM